ncbi:hypothetical protein V6N13_071813 [Hibiscus sabdariffa]|uniref:Uncharacterized protein n=2 Tax=Hibiscus sabdariffa TaxID=183260 RepID=A0ABR1ZB70_9ROSI
MINDRVSQSFLIVKHLLVIWRTSLMRPVLYLCRNLVYFYSGKIMLDLSSLMANLRFTKEDLDGLDYIHFDEDTNLRARNRGDQHVERGKEVMVHNTKPKHYKRSDGHKEGEGSISTTKKARSVAAKMGVDASQEGTSPILVIIRSVH